MRAEDLLKEVNGILVIDLLQYVQFLDNKYGHCFKDPEPGIYFLNKVDPVIVPEQKVYTRAGLKKGTPLSVLENIKESIIDADGNTIIPAYIMERQRKFLSTEPNLPVRAIKLASIVVEEYVDSLLTYTTPQDFISRAKEHLIDEGFSLYENGYMEAACQRIISEVANFIGADIWNFYFFETRNTDLIITKACDFRIYDWTLIQEERREIARQKEEYSLNS